MFKFSRRSPKGCHRRLWSCIMPSSDVENQAYRTDATDFNPIDAI